MHKVSRIFHPIGQGAFYSERHDNYNIVYDCGEWKNSLAGDKVVRQSFRKSQEIDILFISHFDFDHISKIGTLKSSVKSIKNVVIPLLNKEEKHLICNIYRAMDYDLLTLIDTPEKYFGSQTRVIKVRAYKDSDARNDLLQHVDRLRFSEEIDSGTRLTLNNTEPSWIFVPYNFEHEARHQQLLEKLKDQKVDVKKITAGPEYILNMSSQDRKKIKEAYNSVDGKINTNSMFVYSGVALTPCFASFRLYQSPNLQWSSPFHWGEQRGARVGCIYSGDGDLSCTPLQLAYAPYWENVGMIQIPHHGDIKCFDPAILSQNSIICPISYGNRNTYGHPSSALHAEILSAESIPFDVTEDQKSTLIQLISYRKK